MIKTTSESKDKGTAHSHCTFPASDWSISGTVTSFPFCLFLLLHPFVGVFLHLFLYEMPGDNRRPCWDGRDIATSQGLLGVTSSGRDQEDSLLGPLESSTQHHLISGFSLPKLGETEILTKPESGKPRGTKCGTSLLSALHAHLKCSRPQHEWLLSYDVGCCG